jgi:site-specific DNA-methyltransferase (adenine-specific)
MNHAPFFSKASDLWETPDDLFMELHQEFDFTVDGAATAENAKLPAYWSDSLNLDWAKPRWDGSLNRVFLNPPYSQCFKFVRKAYNEAAHGATVVMLLPVRSDTKWFHNWVWDTEKHKPKDHPDVSVEVRFIKGRVKYINPDKPDSKNSAPFPSMVVVFKPKPKQAQYNALKAIEFLKELEQKKRQNEYWQNQYIKKVNYVEWK